MGKPGDTTNSNVSPLDSLGGNHTFLFFSGHFQQQPCYPLFFILPKKQPLHFSNTFIIHTFSCQSYFRLEQSSINYSISIQGQEQQALKCDKHHTHFRPLYECGESDLFSRIFGVTNTVSQVVEYSREKLLFEVRKGGRRKSLSQSLAVANKTLLERSNCLHSFCLLSQHTQSKSC